MPDSDEMVSVILQRMNQGDPSAQSELFPAVYESLRRRARHYMANERMNHTLQATAVVNEAYVKLVGGSGVQRNWQGSQHFFNAAAEAMRQILVDHARRKRAEKRGGDRRAEALDAIPEPVDADQGAGTSERIDLEALDHALTKLKAHDERQHQVVMYRYFAGLTDARIAELLNVSDKTVQRDWRAAKLFLLSEMG